MVKQFTKIASRKDRYLQMFKDNELVEKEIAWAIKSLKREDRIMWFLRLLKQGKNLENIKWQLEQIFDNPSTKVDKYIFDSNKEPYLIIQDLQELITKDKKRKINPLKDKIFKKLSNEWIWYDLESSCSEEEGRAMGHCGEGIEMEEDDSQTLLSLRKIVLINGEKHIIPCVTASLSNGYINQIKGRGNSVPVKYKKQIVELLKDPRIKFLAVNTKPNAYEDFNLNYLTEKEQEEVFRSNPSLKNPEQHLNLVPLEYRSNIIEQIKDINILYKVSTTDEDPISRGAAIRQIWELTQNEELLNKIKKFQTDEYSEYPLEMINQRLQKKVANIKQFTKISKKTNDDWYVEFDGELGGPVSKEFAKSLVFIDPNITITSGKKIREWAKENDLSLDEEILYDAVGTYSRGKFMLRQFESKTLDRKKELLESANELIKTRDISKYKYIGPVSLWIQMASDIKELTSLSIKGDVAVTPFDNKEEVYDAITNVGYVWKGKPSYLFPFDIKSEINHSTGKRDINYTYPHPEFEPFPITFSHKEGWLDPSKSQLVGLICVTNQPNIKEFIENDSKGVEFLLSHPNKKSYLRLPSGTIKEVSEELLRSQKELEEEALEKKVASIKQFIKIASITRTPQSHDSNPGQNSLYEPGTYKDYYTTDNNYPPNRDYTVQTDVFNNTLSGTLSRGASDNQLIEMLMKNYNMTETQAKNLVEKQSKLDFTKTASTTVTNKITLSFTPEEKAILEKIQAVAKHLGIKVFLAGGLIRDRLLGIPNDDLDFVTNKDSDKLAFYLAQQYKLSAPVKMDRSGATMIHMDNKYLDIIDAIKVFTPMLTLEQGQESEMTIFLDDSFRRDLTINSLMYGLHNQKLYDPTGKGISDLRNKIIRTIIDPFIKYKISAPDMLRALRFYSTKDGFKFAPHMLEAMEQNGHLLTPRDEGGDISSRRIERELRKSIKTPEQWNKMKGALIETGLDKHIGKQIEDVEADMKGDIEYNFDKKAHLIIPPKSMNMGEFINKEVPLLMLSGASSIHIGKQIIKKAQFHSIDFPIDAKDLEKLIVAYGRLYRSWIGYSPDVKYFKQQLEIVKESIKGSKIDLIEIHKKCEDIYYNVYKTMEKLESEIKDKGHVELSRILATKSHQLEINIIEKAIEKLVHTTTDKTELGSALLDSNEKIRELAKLRYNKLFLKENKN